MFFFCVLDKYGRRMVKYLRIEYRIDRKEYLTGKRRESGSSAASLDVERFGKVRPGAKLQSKVINESGTADNPASYTLFGIRGIFIL